MIVAFPVVPDDDERMDGRRCAALAAATRRGELGLTQQQLAGSAQVDVKTIRDLERCRRWPIATSRARIEAAFGWESGELERLRQEADAADVDIPEDLWDRLTKLTRAELEIVMRMLTARHANAVDLPRTPLGDRPRRAL